MKCAKKNFNGNIFSFSCCTFETMFKLYILINKLTFLFLVIFFGVNSKINSQIPSYIPSTNLVGWWPFNNNANDESGNGNNGALQNGVVATADRFGNTNSAYSFDGLNDRIFINTAFFNNGWSQYTISSWFFLNTISNVNSGNSSHTFFNTSPHQGLGYGMNWGGSGKYFLFAGSGAPSSSWNALFNVKSTQNIVTGVWKNVVLTKYGNIFNLYVDGVFDKTWTSSISIQSYFYKMYFGSSDPLSASEVINGKLDDIGIWDRELTSSEITVIFQSNPTEIRENTFESNFSSVYPSPTNQSLIIDINKFFLQKLNNEIVLTIYSIDGKLVKSEKLNKNELQNNNKLNVESLSKGLYLLKLSSGSYHQNLKFFKD